MNMQVEEFLELFIKELEINRELHDYYHLIDNKERFLWRKAYIEQRLRYVHEHLNLTSGNIWDVGCGYGTTALFLSLNGFNVTGNTLEFYFDKIKDRLNYWSRFGDLSKLQIQYANLFDMDVIPESFDVVIAQDTLHHLEPIGDAINILSKSLKPAHKLIVTEENGRSLFILLKNFSKRGFNRISEYYDTRLKKSILFGNEHARSLGEWNDILGKHGLEVAKEEIEYIRILPPFFFNTDNYHSNFEKEHRILKKLPALKEFLFLGINFTAIKQSRNQ